MKTKWIVVATFALAAGLGSAMGQQAASSAEPQATELVKDASALAEALAGVKISLKQGLEASRSQGKPISGKFELDEGKLQLSVYTSKADGFFEVIVDQTTGKVSRAEAITDNDDLAAAKKQSAAMAKAKIALERAVANAEGRNRGYQAVSVVPELAGKQAVAKIVLRKGSAWKKVDERL